MYTDVLKIIIDNDNAKRLYARKLMQLRSRRGLSIPQAKLIAAKAIWPDAFQGVSAIAMGAEHVTT